MTEQPSLGEIVRRLDHIAQQQRDMLEEMRRDREEQARTYLRRDVWDLAHKSLRAHVDTKIAEVAGDLAEIKAERSKDADRLKQFALSLAVTFITMLVTLAFTVSNYMTGGA